MDPAQIVILAVSLLFALSFHEAAHAWSASKLGDQTARDLGRVTLNPLPHIDPFMTILFPAVLILSGLPPFGAAKPVPVDTRNLANPKRDHALIAAAGPVSNLVLAAIAVLLLRLAIAGGLEWLPPSVLAPLVGLLQASLLVNLILAVFNLLPIPPLDGSWILSSFLSGPVAGLYRSLQPYGFFILMLLIWSGALDFIFEPVIRFGDLLVLQ